MFPRIPGPVVAGNIAEWAGSVEIFNNPQRHCQSDPAGEAGKGRADFLKSFL
jgi:hypothetical protein